MKESKKIIVMCTLLMSVVLLSVGTIAYFRRVVNGNVTGNAGNLVLIVNEADAVLNETFTVSLNRSVEEPYVYPGDSGTFNLNIIATGSTASVDVTINMLRTNLPDNLKFYLDSEYTQELTTRTYTIRKADVMTMTIPVYWYWDGTQDDVNDSLFMNELLEATANVSASIHKPTFVGNLIEAATLDTNVDFSNTASDTNGRGIMMRDGTQDDEYPIVYYRGNINNNNVIFANKCWLIVRTTETGGVKLAYNGPTNSDGSCNNYSGVSGASINYNYTNAFVASSYSKFNESASSPVYVGYMYNDDVNYYSSNTLDVTGYKAHLANNDIDTGTGRHVQNKYDSVVKSALDTWYASNINNNASASMVEDTVWCNDRSITSTTYTIENNSSNKGFYFAGRTRYDEVSTITPTLSCAREVDRFTVDSANGNGDLTYPVGLLTVDEAILAGSSYSGFTTTYLAIDTYYWFMTPFNFNNGWAYNFYFTGGWIGGKGTDSAEAYIRPTISVQLGDTMPSGAGTYAEPYRFD